MMAITKKMMAYLNMAPGRLAIQTEKGSLNSRCHLRLKGDSEESAPAPVYDLRFLAIFGEKSRSRSLAGSRNQVEKGSPLRK